MGVYGRQLYKLVSETACFAAWQIGHGNSCVSFHQHDLQAVLITITCFCMLQQSPAVDFWPDLLAALACLPCTAVATAVDGIQLFARLRAGMQAAVASAA
jgi:hypothetical protein